MANAKTATPTGMIQIRTGKNRLPALPNTPTTAEAGLPEYQASGWFAMQVPRGTPKDIEREMGTDVLPGHADSDSPPKHRPSSSG